MYNRLFHAAKIKRKKQKQRKERKKHHVIKKKNIDRKFDQKMRKSLHAYTKSS